MAALNSSRVEFVAAFVSALQLFQPYRQHLVSTRTSKD